MYLYHFGIRELPFTLTPNTQYFFGLPSHKEAIEVLTTALASGEGFIKVTGEVGTGKTLICRKLLNELDKGFVSAYIPNPYLSPMELRKAVASELNVELSDGGDQQEFTQRIQKRLIEIHKSKRSAVLIIDEAQALPDESIEALRLMTNLETESQKLIQVVLFGQPELNQKIARPELRQLRQRITFSYNLKQMDTDQIQQYVRHRMRVAGHKSGDVFSSGVFRALKIATRGTPRVVNILCHKALMLAFGEGTNIITEKHIQYAAKDTEAVFAVPKPRWLNWLMPSAAVVFLSLAVTQVTYLNIDIERHIDAFMDTTAESRDGDTQQVLISVTEETLP
jgi:MSHA biogenesis protein MshM